MMITDVMTRDKPIDCSADHDLCFDTNHKTILELFLSITPQLFPL